MSALSRRDFFRRFGHNLAEQVDLKSVTGVAKKIWEAGDAPTDTPLVDWFLVARMADMAPGRIVNLNVRGVELVLRSTNSGVRAFQTDGRCVALRLLMGGGIEVNPALGWPLSRCLSHMTGEAVESIGDE